MSTPNPLIPQGSFQSKGGRTSNVQIVVATIVAIHVVFFGGLLLQGCKPDTKVAQTPSTTETNPAPYTLPQLNSNDLYYTSTSNLPSESTAAASTPSPAVSGTTALPGSYQPVESTAITSTPESSVTPPASSQEVRDYSVVKGDSFYKIAKAHGITVAALTKANANVDPSRLRPGAKLKIPAPEPKAPANGAAAGAPASGNTHTVKSGETLTRIARQHGTTVSALRAANNLKTSRLLAGQKLKIPAKGESTNSALTTTQPQ